MKVYLIGIAGTAMSALANLFYQDGYEVEGSDQGFFPPVSDFLKKMDIKINSQYTIKNIIDSNADFFIIGNAISRGNPELEYILTKKLRFYSLSEALRNFFLWGKSNIVVTGTHGKTTTSSLLTYLLNHKSLQSQSSFFIGGFPENFEYPSKLIKNSPLFILEGDEYDTAFFDKRSKFIHYLPEVLIINNIEFDHADIFNSLEENKKTFSHLVRIVPENGLIIYNGDDKKILDVLKEARCKTISFGFSKDNDLQIKELRIDSKGLQQGSFRFAKKQYNIAFPLVGSHNLSNCAACFLVAHFYQYDLNVVSGLYQNFAGIARRQTEIFKNKNTIIIEDFAHHPSAISLTIQALKKKYPGLFFVFCQDLSSNTMYRKTHEKEYHSCFNGVDQLFLITNDRMNRLPQNEKLNIHSLEKKLNYLSCTCCTKKTFIKKLKKIIVENKKKLIILSGSGNFDDVKKYLKDS